MLIIDNAVYRITDLYDQKHRQKEDGKQQIKEPFNADFL